MKTPIILTNPTDEQLEAAFAEHVAGWRDLHHDGVGLEGKLPGRHQEYVPDYLSSFDAVLPYLERPKWYWSRDGYGQVTVWTTDSSFYSSPGGLPVARAAVIALLIAHGVTVNLG